MFLFRLKINQIILYTTVLYSFLDVYLILKLHLKDENCYIFGFKRYFIVLSWHICVIIGQIFWNSYSRSWNFGFLHRIEIGPAGDATVILKPFHCLWIYFSWFLLHFDAYLMRVVFIFGKYYPICFILVLFYDLCVEAMLLSHILLKKITLILLQLIASH